ncbi:MAG: DNA repair protein RadA [Bacillota bacterium]|nr:DNA repair protein RadA [Bacillota bacterium]
MVRSKTKFVCQNCGFENPKYMGRCPNCGEWNTLIEELEEENKNIVKISDNTPVCINNLKSGQYERYDTGILELNRVLGGGLVKGSLTLISGDPGIGKSTLLLKCAENISKSYGKVIYVSGEESGEQIKIRGDRLLCSSPNLFILSETNLETIEKLIAEEQVSFVIIDSIQTMFSSNLSSAPGSVSQVRECANNLMRIGKSRNIPLFIVAHVTKQGDLAGPRVLEHMVDTVLSFEGERSEEYRILRTVKNRFGTTSEIGVFEMREEGLMEILNPSDAFINNSDENSEGSVIVGIVEGTRPILVEIQALVTESKATFPRRTCVGIELNRLNLILAVLEKKLKLPFYKFDVYVNVVGGLNIEGTYGDLGLAAALISSIKSKEIKLNKLIVTGELGLTGEVRKISHCDRVVNEGEKLGFRNIIIPKKNMDRVNNKKINIIAAEDIKEVMKYLFN